MKNLSILFLIFLLSASVFAQKPTKKPTPKKTPQTTKAADEKTEFEKAAAVVNSLERITALQEFIKNFPASEQIVRAQELIVSARAQIGDEKLQAGEKENSFNFFKMAIQDAPTPISDQLFGAVILQIPTNLFTGGEREKAVEIAKIIEEKIGANAKQIIALASYYLGTENSSEGKRLAKKAIEIDAALPSAYQTLGLANRMGFMLDDSIAAYTKALELDEKSMISKRSLADLKRAVGKSDEAITLYRDILTADAEDGAAQTGLILALFDAGKKSEAETEMAKSLEANSNNLFLLVGAAYWYAANKNGERAIELANKAIEIEPRYTWAHIALARGLFVQKKPLEAEKVLLAAKQYGDFPTLDYELATVRFESGFYRESSEILRRSFRLKDNYVRARLGGRVSLEAETFSELLGAERRASIYQPLAADTEENSNQMKVLLDLSQKLDAADATDEQITEAVNKFIGGEDSMKFYRQMFAARQLLQRKKVLPKILEILKEAVPKVDSALTVSNPAAAVLADALYDSRVYAISRNQLIVVPDLPKTMLSNILRGEIEEIAGWTLFEQNKPADAIIRLKRALSILPDKSAWWRSSQWRLGAAFEAENKLPEALDAYIKSYSTESPSLTKYTIIETLYQKVNGSIDGLEAKIGTKPEIVNQTETVAQVKPTPTPTPLNESLPVASPTPTEETKPKTEDSPTPTEEKKTIDESSSTLTEKKSSIDESSSTPTEEKKTIDESSPTLTDEKKPIVEASPTPTTEEKTEVKTEEKTEVQTETVAQNKPTETPKEETKPNETSKTEESKTETKPLFEPIIINIPNNKPKPTETPKTEETKTEESKTEKTTDEKVSTGEVRQRKVVEKAIETCTIIANQESVSLLNGGGTIGVMVGFEEKGKDLKEIKAISSSPSDVQAVADYEFGENTGRVLFVIKSISTKKGIYTVTFEAPCGKKEIAVIVR